MIILTMSGRKLGVPVFINGAIQTLKEVLNRGYKIIIITNQYIINEGYITLEQYPNITDQMLIELKRNGIEIHDIYYCPHTKTEGCCCIKPRIGMINKSLKEYPDINISESFMVGDSTVDMELAINMGMQGFGIGVSYDFHDPKIIQINGIENLISYL